MFRFCILLTCRESLYHWYRTITNCWIYNKKGYRLERILHKKLDRNWKKILLQVLKLKTTFINVYCMQKLETIQKIHQFIELKATTAVLNQSSFLNAYQIYRMCYRIQAYCIYLHMYVHYEPKSFISFYFSIHFTSKPTWPIFVTECTWKNK